MNNLKLDLLLHIVHQRWSMVEPAGLCKFTLGNLTTDSFALGKLILNLGNSTLLNFNTRNPSKGNLIRGKYIYIG